MLVQLRAIAEYKSLSIPIWQMAVNRRTCLAMLFAILAVCIMRAEADDSVAIAPAFDWRSKVDAPLLATFDEGQERTIPVLILLQLPDGVHAGREVRPEACRKVQQALLTDFDRDVFDPVYEYRNIPALFGHLDQTALPALASRTDVASIGGDVRGEAHLDTSVEFIRADSVHNVMLYRGEGRTVAVLDSGIESDHPDFAGRVADGAWHFLDQGSNQGPGAEDLNGHGTNVAGIIGSAGVVAPKGVAPAANILAVQVINSNAQGWLSDWIAGVDYVVSVRFEHPGLCAINMSLGSFDLYDGCPCDFQSTANTMLWWALDIAKLNRIATFASSGNAGVCGTMSSPACLSSAMAVAAVYDLALGREPSTGTYRDSFGFSFADCADDPTLPDQVTCFTNRSICNSLAAPGRLITSAGLSGGTSTYTGTSQAAPHCTAVAALMFQKDALGCDTLTPERVETLLLQSGVAVDDPCGILPSPVRIDAYAAMERVKHPGDNTGDGRVTFVDMHMFLRGLMYFPSIDGDYAAADANCDGEINGLDVQAMVTLLLESP